MNKPTTIRPSMPAYDAAPADDSDSIDLAALMSWIRRRLGTIVVVAALIFGAALLYAYSREPTYVAEATLLIEQTGAIEELLALDPTTPPQQRSNALNNRVQLLRSTTFLERVVDRNELLAHPEFAHLVAGEPAEPRSPVGVFFARFGVDFSFDPRKWIAMNRAGEGRFDANKLAMVMSERMTASPVPNTDAVQVRFEASTPERAAEFANLIVDEFLRDQVQIRAEAAERANEFLTERLEDLGNQVREAERAVAEFTAENELVEVGEQGSVTDQRVAQVNQQLSEARAEAASIEARLRRLESAASGGAAPEAILEVVSSDVIESLRSQRGELRRTLSEYSTRYRDGHPEMIQLREEIWEVEQQLYSELQRITATVRSDLQVARSRVASFETEIDGLQGEQATAGVARVRLRELQRNADSARSLYETFLNRSTEINQQAELERGDARVISRARPPEDPAGPRKSIVLAIGLALALACGAGSAMLMEMLDRGVRTREELEDLLGVQLLASIPLVERRKWRRFGRGGPSNLVTDEPLGAFAESLRTLRSAIAIADLDHRTKVVLFTSSLPSEGKTTTAVSIARSAAEAGQKVLIIDTDLRNSRVSGMINLKDPGIGLTQVLAGDAPLAKALQRDPETALDVLASGSRSVIPTDMFGSDAFKLFLEDVRADYDLVVLDSAPILAVNDTRQAALAVDSVVFVVAWANTPRDAAVQGLAALRDCNAPVRGAVLTMMDMRKMQRYGYGDAAFYHNRYRAYYVKPRVPQAH